MILNTSNFSVKLSSKQCVVYFGETPVYSISEFKEYIIPNSDANCLLLRLNYSKYVFIGNRIVSFHSDPILSLHTDPSPYAVTVTGKIHLFLEDVTLSCAQPKNPYDYYHKNKSILRRKFRGIQGWSLSEKGYNLQFHANFHEQWHTLPKPFRFIFSNGITTPPISKDEFESLMRAFGKCMGFSRIHRIRSMFTPLLEEKLQICE